MSRRSLSNLVMCAVVFFLLFAFTTSCDVPDTNTGLEQRDCVVMIGDSIFALSDNIDKHLKDLSGHEYRAYYISGAQMATRSNGAITIPQQYARATRQGKIRTLIMDGGGNDMLLGPVTQSWEDMEAEVAKAWNDLFEKAKRDGVENIVNLGYYVTATAETAQPERTLEWRRKTERQLIAKAAELGINYAHIDPMDDSWFTSKRPGQYTIIDGIHPTDAASKRLAELIWEAMRANDIEQGGGC